MFSMLLKISKSCYFQPWFLFDSRISWKKINLKKHDDLYIERIKRRFSDSGCNFPLQMDPSCKVAIITGGETGIGLAAANDLLKNGAQVVILAGVCKGDVAVKQLNEEHGEDRACFMPMDVNDPNEFEELFYRVNSVFGGINILFNNAGIMQDGVWEFEVDTNLKSVLRGTLLGFDYMGKEGKCKKKGPSLIINHADVAALEPFPFAPCYAATKAGIMAASQSFGASYHYEKTGVRVVGLLSGPTDTNLLKNAEDKQYDPNWGKALVAHLNQCPPQCPTVVGKAVSYLIKYAPPGSLWTVENGELFITRIPSRHQLNTKVTQL